MTQQIEQLISRVPVSKREEIRIRGIVIKGLYQIDIRRFYWKGQEGKFLASRKGISIPVSQVASVILSLQQALNPEKGQENGT